MENNETIKTHDSTQVVGNEKFKKAQFSARTVYLQVPYAEKNQAKDLGAKWDAKAKLWTAPPGTDLSKLDTWISKEIPVFQPNLSPEDELRQVMREVGLICDETLQLDGKIHRVAVESGAPGSKDGAYCGYADGVPNGWVMNHKTGVQTKWIANRHTLSPEQLEHLKNEAKARNEERAKERESGYKLAANRAFNKLYAASVVPAPADHPYLQAKGVSSFGLSQDAQGNLMIPGYDLSKNIFFRDDRKGTPLVSINQLYANQAIQTLQTITPDGDKKFEPGTKKKGAAFLIGRSHLKEIAFQEWQNEPIPLIFSRDNNPKILLAEGYATGATLHQATGLPVMVAFDAGNLKPVAEAVRALFPTVEITICADNDHASKVNVGVEKAMEAAKAVEAMVLVPDFTDDEKRRGLTDFNDLAQSRGLPAVAKILICGHKNVAMGRSEDNKQPGDNKPVELSL